MPPRRQPPTGFPLLPFGYYVLNPEPFDSLLADGVLTPGAVLTAAFGGRAVIGLFTMRDVPGAFPDLESVCGLVYVKRPSASCSRRAWRVYMMPEATDCLVQVLCAQAAAIRLGAR